jgi:hypothetical protein
MTLQEMRKTEKFVGIEALYNWGTNYDYEQNPFAFLLDLIGFSEENYGEKLVPKANLDYLGLDYLADALKEYVVRPDDAQTFIQALLDAEIVEENECDECGVTHGKENKEMSISEEGNN